MRLGVEVRKFYVKTRVYHFKYFHIFGSWRAVIRTLRGLDYRVIISFKNILNVAWLSSYSFDGGHMG